MGEIMTTEDQKQAGKGTPPSKQAKRDREAVKHWKKSSTEKTEMVKTERRMKKEARKQRDRLKDEFHIKIKAQSNRIEELELLYVNEQGKLLEEEKSRVQAEKALAEIARELENTNKKLLDLVAIQAGFSTQIYQTHVDINNNLYDRHQAETKEAKGKQIIPREILENETKISEQILDIEKNIQKIDDDLKEEKKAQSQRRVNLERAVKKKVDVEKINSYKLLLDLRDSSNSFIKTNQEQLQSKFIALKSRFYKEKNRLGTLLHATRAHNHSYTATLVRLIIGLMIECAIGPRTVTNVLKVLSEYMDIPTPTRSAIAQWFSIVGLYIYNLPIKNADDWIWMIDLSIPVGIRKLCIILGVRKSDLQEGRYNVGHKDMTIIQMEALETVNGETILEQLNKAKDKVGSAPAHLGSDGGSDVNKAKSNFCKENPVTRSFLDISHKCANIMKGLLKNNERWKAFCTFVTECKRQIVQTNIGFISPPKQRTKARFLGLSRTTKWAFKLLNAEGMADLTVEEFVKYDQYLARVYEFEEEIVEWDEAFEILEEIQKEVKRNGLTRGTQDGSIKSTSRILRELVVNKIQMSGFARRAATEVINFLAKEELQLKEGETILASTDILESYFGLWKYRAPEDAFCGVTNIVLGLPVYSKLLKDDLIKDALESLDWNAPNEWAKKNLGPSMYARRIATLKMSEEAETEIGDEIAVSF